MANTLSVGVFSLLAGILVLLFFEYRNETPVCEEVNPERVSLYQSAPVQIVERKPTPPPTPFQVKEICKRLDADIAVVLVVRDEASVLKNLQTWSMNPPCNVGDKPLVDLILYTSKKDPKLETSLRDELQNIEVSCFKNIYFVTFSPVIGHEPQETLDGLQFLTLQIELRPRYDYFFFMEPAVVPLQRRWIRKLYAEVACGEALWVSGSVWRGPLIWPHKPPIFSNRPAYPIHPHALYTTCRSDGANCSEWWTDLKTTLRSISTEGDPLRRSLFYAIWWQLHREESVPITRDVLHFFRFSDFIQHQTQEVLDPQKLLEESPSTFLLTL